MRSKSRLTQSTCRMNGYYNAHICKKSRQKNLGADYTFYYKCKNDESTVQRFFIFLRKQWLVFKKTDVNISWNIL